MHFVRRAALRAASSPSTSFISKPRSLNTSPFAIQSAKQSVIAQSIPRRFFSDEKSAEQRSEGEQGVVSEAIGTAKEYVSDAAESARGALDSASSVASAFAQRSDGFQGRERRPYDSRGGALGERRPIDAKPTTNIYVGNLLFDVTSADLEREFAQFGTVTETRIATDDRGLSKGFGYVYFNSVEAAAAAIEAKHQSVFEGRRIVVNYQLENTRNRNPSIPSKTLFIGNIPFEMSDADLNKLFRDIRNVIDVRVAIDRRSGQPRGFAHADFVDIDSATAGKEALQGKELYGRKLRVDFSAASRERRPAGESAPASASF